MNKDWKSAFNLERASAIVTWAVVSGFSLSLMYNSARFSITHLCLAAVLCILYLCIWLFISSPSCEKRFNKTYHLFAIFALFINVVVIYFVIPINFVAIFMVIFSAITPYYMSIKRAFLLSPLWSIPFYLIYEFYWQQNGILISTFLFWTFNLFALVMVNSSIKERDARLDAEMTNRELRATQALLNQAVKQGERVRIARNIHDLLGHHLTALTINLQVASRTSQGETKKNIDQCHQLAKLLLSDVRDAVSDIRDKSQLDLRASIESMLEKLPNLDVQFHIEENLQVTDIQIADAIVKAVQESITNTLRHAKGNQVVVKLSSQSLLESSNSSATNELKLEIQNNGHMPSSIAQGNGLNGIKERIAEVHGKVEFFLKQGKFFTQIFIPVVQND